MILGLWAAGLAVVGGCGGGGASATACRNGPPCGREDGATSDAPQSTGDAAVASTCGSVQPCGGDVVGNWTFVEECENPTDLAAIEANFAEAVRSTWCPDATLVGIDPEASGSLQFDADGAYSLDLAFGGDFDIVYPSSCVVVFDCDGLTAELQSEIYAGVFPIPSASSVSCSGSSSCLCRATVSAAQSQAGTYAVSDSVVTLMATTGAVLNKDFCVVGDALHILATSTGSSGQPSVDSDVVAVKQ